MHEVLIGLLLFAALGLAALSGAVKAQRGIRAATHQSMTGYAAYIQYMQDKHDLNRFGIAQQLRRRLGGLAVFGISYHTIGLLGGAVVLYGPAILTGGPSVLGYGWPILALLGLSVSASLAELSSAVPTAGGCYHWSSALGGRKWGWRAGWLHIAGYTSLFTLTNIGCAIVIYSCLSNRLGYASSAVTMIVLLALITVSQAAVHYWGARAMRWLLSGGVWLHIAAVLVIAGGLMALSWPGLYSSEMLYSRLPAAESHGVSGLSGSLSWLIGLLWLQRLFIGQDGAGHGAEEASDPRVRVPWAIYLSSVYTSIVGFALLAFMTLSWMGRSAPAPGESGSLFVMMVQAAWSNSILVLLLIAACIWLSGLQAMGVLSRSIFAMARDHSLPLSRKLAYVEPGAHLPIYSLLASAGMSLLLGVMLYGFFSQEAIPFLAAAALISLHAAYAIPIALRLRAGERHALLQDRVWHLGSWSRPAAWLSLLWLICAGLAAALIWNRWAGAAVLGGFLLSQLADLKYGSRHLAAMQGMLRRTQEEIIGIERKFPQQ
ncbi:amino acid permease [Paenibacillus sp. GCM10023252]|uniref:amino acid permease n=1 Tax=Paenibacillus sp. GCM10023252 TaxID=3252649 RepID=UPI00361250E1